MSRIEALRSKVLGARSDYCRHNRAVIDDGEVTVIGWNKSGVLGREELVCGRVLYSQGFSCCIPLVTLELGDNGVAKAGMMHVFNGSVDEGEWRQGEICKRMNVNRWVLLVNGWNKLQNEVTDGMNYIETVDGDLVQIVGQGDKQFPRQIVDVALGLNRDSPAMDVMIFMAKGRLGLWVWKIEESELAFEGWFDEVGELIVEKN